MKQEIMIDGKFYELQHYAPEPKNGEVQSSVKYDDGNVKIESIIITKGESN